MLLACSMILGACQPAKPTIPATKASPPLPPPAPNPVITGKDIKESQQAPAFTILAHYPFLEKSSDPRFNYFNQESERVAREIVRDFKKAVTPNATQAPSVEGSSYMEIKYEIPYGSVGLLSVRFTIEFYLAGAAHPNQYYQTITMDLGSQRTLALADIFKPGIDFIKLISDYCLQDLRTRKVLEFEGGAQPKPENFRSWNLTQKGLLISFDPYQVGPYAMGPQEVSIPYNLLKSSLNIDYPFSTLVQE